jgi:predicted component of type VI protein secretion system
MSEPAWCFLCFGNADNTIAVRGKSFAIGRSETNDFVVSENEGHVSGTHCTLEPASDAGFPPVLHDRSMNGTWINDKDKVHKGSRQLEWGDRVQISPGNKVRPAVLSPRLASQARDLVSITVPDTSVCTCAGSVLHRAPRPRCRRGQRSCAQRNAAGRSRRGRT